MVTWLFSNYRLSCSRWKRGRGVAQRANPANGTIYGTTARRLGAKAKAVRQKANDIAFFLQLGVGCRTGQGLLCCCDGGSSVLPHHCCQDRSLYETQRASPRLRPSREKHIVIWC